MTRRRNSPMWAYCPVCRRQGTTKGLAGHVLEKHPEAMSQWPQWREIAADNWRLEAGESNLPTGIVSAISDYPECPPWWWAIDRRGSIVSSGTASEIAAAKHAAWTEWLRAVGDERIKAKNGARNQTS